jgi:hypothetical protein
VAVAPNPAGNGTFVRNPDLFRELAHSDGIRDFLHERATVGARLARTHVRTYGGPTWKHGVTRMGDYAAMTFAEVELRPTGWRSKFGSDAPWTAQVEYGTGKKKRRRQRIRKVSLVKKGKKKVSLVKGKGGSGGSSSPPAYTTVTTYYRTRPQKGWSPKQRPLRKSLVQLRSV